MKKGLLFGIILLSVFFVKAQKVTFTLNGELYDMDTTAIANFYQKVRAAQITGGGGITDLTGDGVATGPGSAALTLATVNSNVGLFGSASKTLTATVNGKGLTTAMAETNIAITESQVTNLVSDMAGKKNNFSIADSAILNQYAAKQTARLWIDSAKVASRINFFDDSVSVNYSATSSFPYNHPLGAHSSININAGKRLQDINFIVRDSASQVNFFGPIGFKIYDGNYSPDYGTGIGGFAYRNPTESMVKPFGIWRLGQHLWESDSAQWYMSLTPYGLNIGSLADNTSIPKSAFEVARSLWSNNGNMAIGSGYARTFAAPNNGAAIQGALVLGLNSSASSVVNLATGTYTFPSSISAFTKAMDFQITGAGSSAQVTAALNIDYLAGNTSASRSIALRAVNGNAVTGTSLITSANGGIGAFLGVNATSAGSMTGAYCTAQGGNQSVGLVAVSTVLKNNATNGGAVLLGRNTGTTPIEFGAYIGLNSTDPTFASAAEVVDNSDQAVPIVLWRDNGTVVATMSDGGNLFLGGTTTTATAKLHLGAGTTAASTAPQKFTIAGAARMSSNERGAVQVYSNRLTYTDSTNVEYLIHAGGTPIITAGAGAGTSPTVSISGTDESGYITVTTGTIPVVSSAIATVTFSSAYPTTPKYINTPAANSNSAILSGASMVYVDQATGISTTTWTLSAGTIALTAATTYQFFYRVMQ